MGLLCHPGLSAPPKTAPLAGSVTRALLPTTLVRPLSRKEPRREVLVYTPPGYDDPANAHRRYPSSISCTARPDTRRTF